MKNGVSILRPSAYDLQNYGMLQHVDSDEKPLWLGFPNMRYAFIFAAPVLILCLIVWSAYYRTTLGFGCDTFSVRVGFECGQSATEARGKIFFDLFTASVFLFEVLVVAALKYVSYLITDKHIHIFIENHWCVNIANKTRLAISKNGGRHFCYDLARLRRLEVRSSIFNKNVGSIYLCNVNFDGTISGDNSSCVGKTYNQTNENGDIVKIKNKQAVFPGSWTLSLTNIIYAINDIDSLCDAITEIYAASAANKK